MPKGAAQRRNRTLLPEVSIETALWAYKLAYLGLVLGGVFVLGSTLLLWWSDGEIKRHDDVRFSANEAETARAKESAAKADEAAAKANERAASLELEAAKLRAQFSGRRLSKEQIVQLASAIRALGFKPEIFVTTTDPEAIQYRDDIVAALKMAGDPKPHWSVGLSGGSFVGLAVARPNDQDKLALAKALLDAGLNNGRPLADGGSDPKLKIIIGAMPPPE